MSAEQIQNHRDVYEQLRARITAPGDAFWRNGELIEKPYAPIDKWSMTFDDLMTCPDTPRIAYYRARYARGSLATVGMRRAS